MVRPPVLRSSTYSIRPVLPEAESVAASLRGADFAKYLEGLGEQLLRHRIPLLGYGEIDCGPDVDWSRDYIHGRSSELKYFRKIPYLDFHAVGDHKIVWELNRHQHLITLAQCFRLTGDQRYLDKVEEQLKHWIIHNPFQRGINWTSALEVAFRALSWVWVYHLAGKAFSGDCQRSFINALYQHGLHLKYNLSHYFSPNTHLLGEAIALHAIGHLFPELPNAKQWCKEGGAVVDRELYRQVLDDGAHCERSTYYHVYAADMFLFHAVIANKKHIYESRLSQMATYLAAILGSAGQIPFLGDDDGGRMFHPFGRRDQFGRATLATLAIYLGRGDLSYGREELFEQAVWWLGPEVLERSSAAECAATSHLFPNVGIAVLSDEKTQCVIDVGGFGPGSSGHSHADALSLTISHAGEEILIDPGTFTYISDVELRNYFRGTTAHNTVQIDQIDQAIPAEQPFKWLSKPNVKLLRWNPSKEQDCIEGECCYGDVTHRRCLLWVKPDWLFVIDQLTGSSGSHDVELFWHTGVAVQQESGMLRIGSCVLLPPELSEVRVEVGGKYGWRSRALGQKEEAPVVIVRTRREFPAVLVSAFDFRGLGGQIVTEDMAVRVLRDGQTVCRAALTEVSGVPEYSSL
jgi:hypothetical protein